MKIAYFLDVDNGAGGAGILLIRLASIMARKNEVIVFIPCDSNKVPNKEYVDRLNEIAKIAAITINSNIEFIASWDLKENNIYTETSRKYIGKMNFLGIDRLVYYISKDKDITYIGQIINDVQKIVKYDNIIIFLNIQDMIFEFSVFWLVI